MADQQLALPLRRPLTELDELMEIRQRAEQGEGLTAEELRRIGPGFRVPAQ